MQRTIAHYDSVLDLLQDTLQGAIPTSLLVASCKEEFFEQLVSALYTSQTPPEVPEIPSSQDDENDVETTAPLASRPHPLLITTLNQLAASKKIHLAFCPTIDSLRAYLASQTGLPSSGNDPILTSTVILLNAIALHHGTSEFSLQGLSRTLALAVSSAAARQATHLRLVEIADIHDPANPAYGHRLWDAQVPLLSGSVRLASEGARWAGRMISVRLIAGRWFQSEKQRTPAETSNDNKEPEDVM